VKVEEDGSAGADKLQETPAVSSTPKKKSPSSKLSSGARAAADASASTSEVEEETAAERAARLRAKREADVEAIRRREAERVARAKAAAEQEHKCCYCGKLARNAYQKHVHEQEVCSKRPKTEAHASAAVSAAVAADAPEESPAKEVKQATPARASSHQVGTNG
jgi:hypothetical protein